MARKPTTPAGAPKETAVATPPAVINPTFEQAVAADRESARVATVWFDEQCAERTRAPRYVDDLKGGPLRPVQYDGDAKGFQRRLSQALGSTSSAFTEDVVKQLAKAPSGTPDFEIARRVNVGLAFIASQHSKDELETTILLQFWLTNRAMLRHVASVESATVVDHLNVHGGISAKLGNLGVRYLEAFAKLRGGGKQEVVVTHVHQHVYVADGGQAVVGGVQSGGGGEARSGAQPHGAVASLAFAPGSPVWSENPARDAVPVTSDEGEREVSRSRRARRSAEG
jgi:hypothetical protein